MATELKQQVVGYYSRDGYVVHLDGEPLYTAGNLRFASDQWAKPGTSAALPLRLIRKFCLQTARRLAREKSARFAGIEREDCLFS